jgi:hypothetical protein
LQRLLCHILAGLCHGQLIQHKVPGVPAVGIIGMLAVPGCLARIHMLAVRLCSSSILAMLLQAAIIVLRPVLMSRL